MYIFVNVTFWVHIYLLTMYMFCDKCVLFVIDSSSFIQWHSGAIIFCCGNLYVDKEVDIYYRKKKYCFNLKQLFVFNTLGISLYVYILVFFVKYVRKTYFMLRWKLSFSNSEINLWHDF